MKSRFFLTILLAIAVLALPSLACSITFNLPDTVDTTTTRTMDIAADVPVSGQTTELRIEMGSGELEITGGGTGLVDGSVRYNVENWQPSVTTDGNRVEIIQGSEGSIDIPDRNVINEWNLRLGNTPIDLQIQAGAYQGTLDLSGIPITNLRVSDGASRATVKFDSLNPARMEQLTYKTGASQVDLEGLGNANATEILFEGGAGSYTLDFSGDLQQDLSVHLSAGISNVRINVPENARVRVEIGGGLSNVSVGGTWTTNGDVYERSGSGPLINIKIDMGLGNLELRVR
jgi:hypothetical protein